MLEFTLVKYMQKLMQPKPLIILISLIAICFILFFISKKNVFNARVLSYGAMAITLSFLLSFVKLFSLPFGGTITLASMLPIIIFAYIFGVRAGIAAGLCYGMLQFIQDPFLVHWAQFILDYPLAFSLLGLSGLFKRNVYKGAAIGIFGRFVCHFLSGVIFFGMYAGDQNIYVYSLLYNLSYILPDAAISFLVLTIPNFKIAISRLRTI